MPSHPSSGPPDRRATRTGERKLELIQRDLSDREQAILRSIDQHRFLTTGHIQALHFHDHATTSAASRICRRVLARLLDLRVIDHLERRVGGIRAGSASYVWRVGEIGDRLLRIASGEGLRQRRKEPSDRHLDHCLAVADCHVALVAAARAGQLDLITFETEPSCWRSYLAGSGSREFLKPDLYVVTATGDYEDHWFIEVDRATESLPTIARKCAQYERYRRTGREEQAGGVFPLVVWLVPDETRRYKVRAAIAATRGLDSQLFRVTTAGRLIDLTLGADA